MRSLMLEFSELSPEMRERPHEILAKQRAACPVERDGYLPYVFVSSYAEGREILRDDNLSRRLDVASPDNPVVAAVKAMNAKFEARYGRHSSMIYLDSPDHERVRGAVARRFLPRVNAVRPAIERLVNQELARLSGVDAFDAVHDYAWRIPIPVVCAALGLEEADFNQLRAWTDAGAAVFNPYSGDNARSAAEEARGGLFEYFTALLRRRRSDPGHDMMSELLADQAAGVPISDDEVIHNHFALMAAGHLTTVDLIATGAYLLCTHPPARALLAQTPDLWPQAIEEILRFEPPISQTGRFAPADQTRAGCPVHRGDALGVSLLSANRDPEKFQDPDRFDIARAPNPHMAFGAGAHICLGAPLARIEGAVALAALFSKFPNLRLANPQAPPHWRASPGLRGLERLDVRAC